MRMLKKSSRPLTRALTPSHQAFHLENNNSLLFSGAVSRLTGLGLLLLICVNLFLFIPASSGIGTSLYLNLIKDGMTSSSPAIHWSLKSSFAQMMNAHAYMLGWLVMFASGVWPYTKLFILLAALVFKPMKYVNVRFRQNLLVLVDTVGKFSLLDSFFMFLYEALISARWSNESGSRKLSVSIEPDFGFILFFAATIMCLLLGHAVLLLHRLSLHQDRTTPGTTGECFSLHGTAPRWLRFFVPTLLLMSIALWPFALLLTSLHTKVTGGLGVFYDLVDMDTNLDVSIFFVVTGPWRVLGYHTWTSLGWRLVLTTLALLFVVVLPACFCLALVVVWFTPLRRKGRFAGLACIQCLRAWAALDICAFTMFVSWGFGPPFFRSFTMDPSQAFSGICKGLQSTLGLYCFDLKVDPQPGLWIALSQSIVVLVASVLVSKQADLWLNMSGEHESQVITASIVSSFRASGVTSECDGTTARVKNDGVKA